MTGWALLDGGWRSKTKTHTAQAARRVLGRLERPAAGGLARDVIIGQAKQRVAHRLARPVLESDVLDG